MEHVGSSPTKQTWLAPNTNRREVVGREGGAGRQIAGEIRRDFLENGARDAGEVGVGFARAGS